MATSRSRSYYKKQSLTSRQFRRDAAAVANDWSLPDLTYLTSRSIPTTPERILSDVQDLRRFDFDDYPHPRTVTGGSVRVGVPLATQGRRRSRGHGNLFALLSPRISIKEPSRALVCLRRQRRKEVIHAKRIAGSRVMRPRYNSLSKLHCR